MKLLIIFLSLKFGFSVSGNWSVGKEQEAVNAAATNEAIQKDTFLNERVKGLESLNNLCIDAIPRARFEAQQIAAANQTTCNMDASAQSTIKVKVENCLKQAANVIQEMQGIAVGMSCEKIAKTTQISCEASTYAPWVGMVTGQLGASSSGNMYDKCKKAANLQLGMSTISAGLAATCAISKKKCENTCGKISKSIELAEQTVANARRNVMAAQQALHECGVSIDPSITSSVETAAANYRKELTTTFSAIEKCEKYELNVMSALMSATQLVQGIAQSQSCQKELAQDECTKPEATQNPACTAAYCSVAANQSAPQCVAIFGECYSANAAANPKCACLQNPMQQSCLNLPTVDINTPNRNTASNVDNSGYNFDEDDLYGAQGDSLGLGDPNAKAPGVSGGGQQGGGGGGAGSGTALGGGPGGGGGGSQKGVYDTNVTGGTSAGGGGGGSGGGIAGYGSGANTGYGTGGAGGMNFGKSSLDLKKYLPGGQLAKQRDEQDTGITSANGLSNFQKVNRAHNKSRGQLVNP